MCISMLRKIAVVALLPIAMCGTADRAPGQADPKKTEIVLPKDPQAVVVALHVTGGMIRNKTTDPYLQIQADGRVILTNRIDGTKKESKLTAGQLQDLLRFVIQENDIFNVDATKIQDEIKAQQKNGPAIRVGDGITSRLVIKANNKEHEVSYYAAGTFAKQYPKVKTLAQFAAVEGRLHELANSVQKGK